MGVTASAAVAGSLALEALLGEPPAAVHPVAVFGRVVDRVDRPWPNPRLVGWLLAGGLPLGAAAVAGGLAALALRVGPVPGTAVAALALFSTTSLRMLLSVATDVVEASASDPASAREAVRALVGRDPAGLSPAELRSAAVESAAENLVDGLVAPLLAFALASQVALPAGVAAAVWVKAVNTLDSVLGYRTKPAGGPSARLDDAVMWLPARVGAVLLALAGRAPGALGRARAWSREPASPNSGWPMATLAAALDVSLSKPGAYTLHPDADLPTVADARAGIAVVRNAGLAAFLLAGVVAWP